MARCRGSFIITLRASLARRRHLAAATTSMPRSMAGCERDYRYGWLRDATGHAVPMMNAGYLMRPAPARMDPARDRRNAQMQIIGVMERPPRESKSPGSRV